MAEEENNSRRPSQHRPNRMDGSSGPGTRGRLSSSAPVRVFRKSIPKPIKHGYTDFRRDPTQAVRKSIPKPVKHGYTAARTTVRKSIPKPIKHGYTDFRRDPTQAVRKSIPKPVKHGYTAARTTARKTIPKPVKHTYTNGYKGVHKVHKRTNELPSMAANKIRGRIPKNVKHGFRDARIKTRQAIPKPVKHTYTKVRKTVGPKRTCTFCKILTYVTCITLMIVSSLGLVVAKGHAAAITPDFIAQWIPSLRNEDLVDPFSKKSSGSTTVPKWYNEGGNGLDMTLKNALTGDWQVIFALAVTDWDFGTPDALTLSSEQVSEDSKCEPVQGVIKVCNGDYGETNWRGINNAMLDAGGYIIASAAKMNEYYLANDLSGAKQYTMCHEIGHAFGIPHSDEDFDNEDLGNCMDYTNNFAYSSHPDNSNYEFLVELYGVVQGSAVARARSRLLRGRTSLYSDVQNKMPDHTREEMVRVLAKLEKPMGGSRVEDGWRLLHRNEYSMEHEIDLGDGYKLRSHMLMV